MIADECGSWMEIEHRLQCIMCGAAQEPGSRIRYDPEAGGLVCERCGQPEPDEEPRILGQLDSQEDASPLGRKAPARPSVAYCLPIAFSSSL